MAHDLHYHSKYKIILSFPGKSFSAHSHFVCFCKRVNLLYYFFYPNWLLYVLPIKLSIEVYGLLFPLSYFLYIFKKGNGKR